ncbi:MAG TPA: helix-turn-helix domain-containing protein, partial [Candidatus Nanoarchaeia archaeon]|nr:helix-turn-helix domain-containing protein [Candidatus Nanoarchaeia archaeon]
MPKDPFLLVSLEENESKALAQVISNDTARKILDFLSKHESATESDISKKLDVPLSTVHYNLQALSKANLVKAEEFHYSEKGKEVLHYSLANKLIIIAPKKTSTESFKDKLKSILPVAIIVLAVGVLL